jgi:hypothetical protein
MARLPHDDPREIRRIRANAERRMNALPGGLDMPIPDRRRWNRAYFHLLTLTERCDRILWHTPEPRS